MQITDLYSTTAVSISRKFTSHRIPIPTQILKIICILSAGSSKPLSRNKLTVEAVAPKTQPGQQQANKFLRRSRIPVKMTAKRQSSAVPPQSTNHGLHKRSPAATIAVAATTDSSIPSASFTSHIIREVRNESAICNFRYR